MYKKGSFAYSKWELTTSHSLYRLMGEMMESREVRRAIANVMWPDQSRGTRGLADDDEAARSCCSGDGDAQNSADESARSWASGDDAGPTVTGGGAGGGGAAVVVSAIGALPLRPT